jgi:hypothetical protein
VQANQQALIGMRDQGLRGCQISTNPSSCVPNYPG